MLKIALPANLSKRTLDRLVTHTHGLPSLHPAGLMLAHAAAAREKQIRGDFALSEWILIDGVLEAATAAGFPDSPELRAGLHSGQVDEALVVLALDANDRANGLPPEQFNEITARIAARLAGRVRGSETYQ